jgi:capsular polysaccharide transport system permease protein
MFQQDLWRDLSVQLRVIGALLIREIHTRFGRENLGFGWIIAEPLVFALPVLAMWSALRSPVEHGLRLIPFLWSGYLPLLLFRHIGGRMLMFVRVNAGLLYHRQVSIFDLFVARALLEILSNLAAMIFSFALLLALGVIDWPRDPPMFYLGYFYMVWWSVSVGLIIGGLSERSDLVEKIWSPISYMYMAVSGFFFLAAWLPPPVRSWGLTVMPSIHAYEMLRGGLFGPTIHTYGDPVYMSFVCAILTLIGLVLIRESRKYIVAE